MARLCDFSETLATSPRVKDSPVSFEGRRVQSLAEESLGTQEKSMCGGGISNNTVTAAIFGSSTYASMYILQTFVLLNHHSIIRVLHFTAGEETMFAEARPAGPLISKCDMGAWVAGF